MKKNTTQQFMPVDKEKVLSSVAAKTVTVISGGSSETNRNASF